MVKRELILGCLALAVLSSCSSPGRTEQHSFSPRAKEIQTALNQTVIPVVDLERVTPDDALKFWQDASRSSHPQHFKFTRVMSHPSTYTVQTTAPGETKRVPTGVSVPKVQLVTVRRKNITSERLLDEICQQANLTWTITGRVIVIKPGTTATSDSQ